ncbi:MAG: hypothetical protein NE328_15490 [Lentisphaeraceae bacterium]|nr:hypothetical protein [Lentisphaeraceae bacterium]
MEETKKITDKNRQIEIAKKVGIIACSVLISGAVIASIHKSSQEFAKERLEEKDKNIRNINHYFNECKKQAIEGNYAMARKNLFKITPDALKPELKALWFETMTEIYFQEARAFPEKRDFLVLNALNYAQRGLDIFPDRVTADNLSKVKAELYLLNKQYKPASELLLNLEARSTTPKDRWQFRMDAAFCFKQMKMNKKAIQLLDSVIDETDEQEIWAQAMRRKGDIYLKNTDTTPENYSYKFEPSTPVIPIMINQSIEQFNSTNKAQSIYQEVVDGIPHNMHPEKIRCLVNLLEIFAQKGSIQEAYTIANAIKRSASSRPEAASVYTNMAKLEARRGNLERAATYMDHMITSHPDHHLMEDAFQSYYSQLKKAEKWDVAFDLVFRLVSAPTTNTIRMQIIEDFHLGEDKLLNNIDMSKTENQKKVTSIIESVVLPSEEDKEVILFAKASFHFATKNYYMADVLFSQYLKEMIYEKFREQAFYYYLASAVNDNKPPILRALRAKIYLNNTYHEARSQDVTLYLMAAYYDMGMWEESIEAAMKVFVNEIVKMGEEKENYRANEEWLKAVARIGQSYERIGRKADASNVFDTWAPEFKKSPYAASIYSDWAQLASSNRQHHEALRRYNVIMPYVIKPEEFLELASLRCIQKLKINFKEARKEGYGLVKKLPSKIELLGEEKVDTLTRDIYKALLENSLSHDHDNIENLFTKILSLYKSEPWPYTFIIKWLQDNLDSPEYKNINKYFQTAVSGPLSALKEDKVKNAIMQQAKMLIMLEKENVF